MTTRRPTVLERAILAYLIVGAAVLYVALLLAPVLLLACVVGLFR